MIFLLISFVSGILTVLAPCVLPLLPVIIGGSVEGKTVEFRKLVTIVSSLGISVILFTILLKVTTVFISVPQSTWACISGGLVMFIGATFLFPRIWENKFVGKINMESNAVVGKGYLKQSRIGDILIGAALGPVFSSCSPTYLIVLATVLPETPLLGGVYLLAYTLGLCLSLFAIAFLGQNIVQKCSGYLSSRKVQVFVGIVFICVGVLVFTGVDKRIEAYIIQAGFFDVTSIEQAILDKWTR